MESSIVNDEQPQDRDARLARVPAPHKPTLL